MNALGDAETYAGVPSVEGKQARDDVALANRAAGSARSRCAELGVGARASSYAATSRLNRPGGKSQSGRSPRSGLYTASAAAASSLTSQRKIAFVLHGIRSRTVTSPRARRVRASTDDVTVAPRADVPARIQGGIAQQAERPTGLHERLRPRD